jgi:type III secretory pathway lipoprotein EscJ
MSLVVLFSQLKDLLANAFDDLEAEDICSVASDESHDSGRHSDEIGYQPLDFLIVPRIVSRICYAWTFSLELE